MIPSEAPLVGKFKSADYCIQIHQISIAPDSVREYMIDVRNTDSWFTTCLKMILKEYQELVSVNDSPTREPTVVKVKINNCKGFSCKRNQNGSKSIKSKM